MIWEQGIFYRDIIFCSSNICHDHDFDELEVILFTHCKGKWPFFNRRQVNKHLFWNILYFDIAFAAPKNRAVVLTNSLLPRKVSNYAVLVGILGCWDSCLWRSLTICCLICTIITFAWHPQNILPSILNLIYVCDILLGPCFKVSLNVILFCYHLWGILEHLFYSKLTQLSFELFQNAMAYDRNYLWAEKFV